MGTAKKDNFAIMSKPPVALFSDVDGSMMFNILRPGKDGEAEEIGSNTQNPTSAMKILPHPLNMLGVSQLKDASPHHAACITTKKNCIIGLGFVSSSEQAGQNASPEVIATSLLSGTSHVRSAVDDALDPLTMFSFHNELSDWVEDFLDTGTGYLEVVREGETIKYIGTIPVNHVRVVVQGRQVFFVVSQTDGTNKYFSRFGVANKKKLFEPGGPYFGSSISEDDVSELIMLTEPTNRCRYYGYPSWLAAVVDIDLLKKAKQYKADFYHNRGVLDFILTIIGESMDEDTWDEIKSKITGTSGMGNNFKSMSLKLDNPDASIQVDKLAGDMKSEDQFSKDNEVFSQNIVSAHGVPPLLANILIPGKLGATNEFVNSLIGFQLLRIGPAQALVQKALATTLGNPELNGGLKLKPEDFQLRTITSQINLQGLDTVSRMREEAPTADRDLTKGVKS